MNNISDAFITSLKKNLENKHIDVETFYTALTDSILAQPQPCFLLPDLSKTFHTYTKEYPSLFLHISDYEYWLGGIEISSDDYQRVWSNITGKRILDHDFAPMLSKQPAANTPGSHYVIAHTSPDLDTFVSSYITWIDALSLRMSAHMNKWLVPKRSLKNSELDCFHQHYPNDFTTHLVHHTDGASVLAEDICKQEFVHTILSDASFDSLDIDEVEKKCMFIVSNSGNVLDTINPIDVEETYILINVFIQIIRSYVHQLEIACLHAILDKEPKKELILLQERFSRMTFDEISSYRELHDKKKEIIHRFIHCVFGFDTESKTTCHSIVTYVTDEEQVTISNTFIKNVQKNNDIHNVISTLHQAHLDTISALKTHLMKMGTFVLCKQQIFKKPSFFLTPNTVIDPSTLPMDAPFIPVLKVEKNKKTAFGAIQSDIFKQKEMISVSLRDFSNKTEVPITPAANVVSVIDHHKTEIHSSKPWNCIISDTESCNTIIAEHLFNQYDLYSKPYSEKDTLAEITKEKKLNSEQKRTLVKLLLQRKETTEQFYFVDINRELHDYELLLNAILDDTDLLSKTSIRDLMCIGELIDRIVSIQNKYRNSILRDQIDQMNSDKQTIKQTIFKHPFMQATMKRIYTMRIEQVEEDISTLSSGLFSDTKYMSDVSICQVKLFPDNIASLSKHYDKLIANWKQLLTDSKRDTRLDILFFSTLKHKHHTNSNQTLDKMVIIFQQNDTARSKLMHFLNHFLTQQSLSSLKIKLNTHPNETSFFAELAHLENVTIKGTHEMQSTITIEYPASLVNSRKKQIAPFIL
ncbi:DHH family phosphoesterase [Chlamydiia bacterium]|nr:DHH family phosphoesterase [Chlamydiia bacterium]